MLKYVVSTDIARLVEPISSQGVRDDLQKQNTHGVPCGPDVDENGYAFRDSLCQASEDHGPPPYPNRPLQLVRG